MAQSGSPILATAGIAALALAVPAQAQTAPTAASAENTAPPAALQEIVVTAQKRAENIQKVPIAVSAVSGAAIDSAHITSLQGLQGSTPNVQINNFSNTPNTAVYTIRGIGIIEPDPYAGNTVSIVYDGVPQYFSMGALLDLYDIDRVEILRGPQGTLFGANTTGGVVNIITAQPTDEFGGKAQIGYGNWHDFTAAGTINVPVVKGLLDSKFTISHMQRHGWYTNVVDGSDMDHRNVTIYRGYLKLTPSPDFDATLIGEYDLAHNGSPPVVAGDLPGEAEFVPPGPVPGSALPMYPSPCLPAGEPCNAPDKYYSAKNNNIPDLSRMRTWRATLNMNWRHTPIGDLTSITGYKHFVLFEYTDQDGTPVFLDDTRRRTTGWQFSQELRTAVQVNDAINFLLGGFYMKTHYDHVQDFRIAFAAPGLLQVNLQNQDNWSASAFAQGYAQITDRLRVQAGVRYTHERTEMLASTATSINLSGSTDFDGTGNVSLGIVAPPLGVKAWNNVGWKLGLDYKLTSTALLYGYWARGFKSGGFTGRIGIAQDIGPYAPEHVDTFELGLKADWLDRRLRTNLALFYTNYRDMQLATIYFVGSGASVVQGNSIINAASSHIKGAEFEVQAVPFRGLTLNGSMAYLDAKYTKFPFFDPQLGQTTNLQGFVLQNAPKWTGTVGATYKFDVGKGYVSAHVEYDYVGSKYLTSISDAPRSKIQPTNLINANIDWKLGASPLTLGVWGRNLTDKRYIASVFDAPGTLGLVNYASPREYGVVAKMEFR